MLEKLLKNKYLLRIFIFMALMIPALLIKNTYYKNEVNKSMSWIESSASLSFGELESHMNEHVDLMISVANYFKGNQAVKNYFGLLSDNKKTSKELFLDLKNFIKSSGHIYQVRFLSVTGKEIYKVVYKNKKLKVVLGKKLNPPANYYNQLKKLKEDEYFYSKFKLHKTAGIISTPHVPIIELGFPFYLGQKNKTGHIIISFFSHKILGDLQKAQTLEERDLWIVNESGYWLRGSENFNFAFDYAKKNSLKILKPGLWNKVVSKNMAKDEIFEDNGEYYLWNSFNKFGGNRELFFIQKVSLEYLSIIKDQLYKELIILFVSLLVIFSVSSFYLSNLLISNNNYKVNLEVKLKRESFVRDLFRNFQLLKTLDQKILYMIGQLKGDVFSKQIEVKLFIKDPKLASEFQVSLSQYQDCDYKKMSDCNCRLLMESNDLDLLKNPSGKNVITLRSKSNLYGTICFEHEDMKDKGSEDLHIFFTSIGQIFGTEIEGYINKSEMEDKKVELMENAKTLSLGIMAGGVAHEINNPLAIIKASGKKIQSRALDEKLLKYSEKIIRNAERIGKIVSSMQRLSRSDDAQDKTFLLSTLINDLSSIFGEKLRAHNIIFKVSEITQDCEVSGDIIQLSQVLINLIDNSMDALKKTVKREVSLNVFFENDRLHITVSDTGKGIKTDDRDKIMEPFFTTKDVGDGTGLGLSLSRKVVEQLDGTLTFDDSKEETCFDISLKKYRLV